MIRLCHSTVSQLQCMGPVFHALPALRAGSANKASPITDLFLKRYDSASEADLSISWRGIIVSTFILIRLFARLRLCFVCWCVSSILSWKYLAGALVILPDCLSTYTSTLVRNNASCFFSPHYRQSAQLRVLLPPVHQSWRLCCVLLVCSSFAFWFDLFRCWPLVVFVIQVLAFGLACQVSIDVLFVIRGAPFDLWDFCQEWLGVAVSSASAVGYVYLSSVSQSLLCAFSPSAAWCSILTATFLLSIAARSSLTLALVWGKGRAFFGRLIIFPDAVLLDA